MEKIILSASEKFFRKSDWTACWVTFVISLIVYTLTLQPTLGLEDSGELIVASDYLGVPHPPGYPIWSLMTWFFQWVLHPITFHGQPNPAWAVNWFSAFTGAAACGAIALLISRSGMDLLRSFKKETDVLGEGTESLFCAVAGVSGGLLLAFGQGMWSQAVIAEVYTFNILFQSLVLVFLYRWISTPDQPKWLMLCAFAFGLGITNHQTLIFMGLAMGVAVLFNEIEIFNRKNAVGLCVAAGGLVVAVWGVYHVNMFLQVVGILGCVTGCLLVRSPYLVRDFVIVGVMYILLVGFNKWAAGSEEHLKYMWNAGPDKPGFWIWTIYALAVPTIAIFALPKGKIVGPTFLVMFIGLGFYLYMPISSDQNPPINWGYPRTWEGFMHAVTRGQYERVKLASVFTPRFLEQIETYLTDLRRQFYWPVALMGLIPIALFPIFRQASAYRWRLTGRIGRFEYFCWTAAWSIAVNLVLVKVLPNDGPMLLPCFFATALILLMPITKRLRDIGHPPLWALFTIIPTNVYLGLYSTLPSLRDFANRPAKITLLVMLLTNLGVFAYLMIRKGAEGDNGHGENPLASQPEISTRNSGWIMTTIVAFIAVGIVFIILQNPKTDIQNLFIGRVQYIQSHAIYVIWLGYGILFLMAWLETLARNNRITKMIGVSLVLALPFSLIYKNQFNEEQLRIYGGSEQGGHDFGWQFGNWQLRGVEGIKDDMRYWYPDEAEFEKQWAAYPCEDYPEPMGPNAIFFGGTDPGRFVPTYMIYSAKVRPDVYLITQNALADGTYMNVMRDLYGDQIWIPSPLDSNRAFQMFYQTQSKAAGVSAAGGKIQVQGVQHVMKINGFLSKMIFDHNQYITESKTDEATRPTGSAVVHEDPAIDPKTGLPPKRTFYVEESYVLPWMYPYLTPHGLIMKINNKPTPLTKELIENDTLFWNWYVDRLINDERFIRDIVARKSFSKLRGSIAGLYAARGKPVEAEAAFRQAILLYDLSPEANFRLADLIAKRGRFDEAIELFDVFLQKDPNNEKAALFLDNLKEMKGMAGRRAELERKLSSGQIEFTEMMNLIEIQFAMKQDRNAEAFARQMIASDDMTPQMLFTLAQYMAKRQKLVTVELALVKMTQIAPDNTEAWVNLAALQLVTNKRTEMYASLRQAVAAGGESVRARLRKDTRFNQIRGEQAFQKIVPPLKPAPTTGFAPLPGL